MSLPVSENSERNAAGPPPSAGPRQRSFVRKVVYVVVMAALLVPLFQLSHPATRAVKQVPGRPGGKLARLREECHLSQTELGQIDPTSETIKLTTLGMRGVAAELLWWKAYKYQMKKDWNNLRTTLEQISRLQPHSIGVWRYQAWNLSYNVSVAFDDYHDKYYWVMEGIKFLQRGVDNNEHEPRLPWDMGWFIAHKIGRADESRLYRRLFKEDDQYHGSRPPELRDNWLVGKEWFRRAEERIDDRHPVRGMAEVIFYSDAPMCQFYYGDALEKEGRFGEMASRAWRQAAADWYDFGQRDVPFGEDMTLRLNDLDRHEEAIRRATAGLNKLAPGLREKIYREKRRRLTSKELAACDTPFEKRTPEQYRLAADVASRLVVTYDEVARRVTGPQRAEARRLADEATRHTELAGYVRRERSKVNFDYWQTRAAMEQTPDALAARQAAYEGVDALRRADTPAARDAYLRALKGWRTVIDRFPSLGKDTTTCDDLVRLIRQYRHCLDLLDEPFPQPFILQDILDQAEKKP